MSDFWKLTGEKLRLTGYILLVFIFIDAMTSPCIHGVVPALLQSRPIFHTVKYLTYPICELHHIFLEHDSNIHSYYSYMDGYLVFAFLLSNIYYYFLKKIQQKHKKKKKITLY